MSIYYGSSPVQKIWFGNQEVQKAWIGSELFYQSGIPLRSLPTGFKISKRENGVAANFVIAQHDYIQSGVTAIERDLCLSEPVSFNSANVNTYNGGALDTFLTGTYRNRLDQDVRDELVTVNIPVTPGNGNYNLTTIARSVFVLSGTENGLSHYNMVVEGSRVDIYTDDASRIKYSDDSLYIARNRWTRSASMNTTANTWRVGVGGQPNVNSAAAANYLAPVLALPSTHSISTIGDLGTGTRIKINENGVPVNYVIAQHDYIQSGVTAIERDLCLSDTVAFNSGEVNTYNGGTLDTFLTGTYRNRLDQNVRNALVTVNIPVTPGNGNYNLTTIPRDVFVLSGTENGLENQYMVVEGSRVDIYTDDASRIKYSDDAPTTARHRWTRSARTYNPASAWGVYANGTADSGGAANALYLAPVLTLPSTFPITADMIVR